MSNLQDNQGNPLLTFDGKKYKIASLPDDIKEMIKGLQIADKQLHFYESTLKILAIGRQSMAAKLKEKLKGINPIEN